jgi:AcrR family transcriptional regulator
MAPRVVDKVQKRESILRAALQVFVQYGVRDFKMIHVAETAGIGKGTLYEYFPSKQALVAGSIALFFDDYAGYVSSRMAQSADPVSKIRTLISASFGFFAEQKERLDIIFQVWGAAMVEVDRQETLLAMSETYRQTRDWLADVISEGVATGVFRELDRRVVASLILATLDGILYQAIAGLTRLDDPELPEKISHIILEGLEK